MLAYVFVLLAIVIRFAIPMHILGLPFQFVPLAASLLFFGAKMPRKQFWIPLVLFAASDVILTKFVYQYPFKADTAVSWIWYAAALALGMMLRKNDKLVRVAGASLIASISFFLISNLGVFLAWNMYPKTWAGLVECYTLALPFFRNTLVSDMVFALAFFSVPVAIELLHRNAARERA
ncbi:MAG: DUF6580 family putative transport protein [Terriglobia bacterium]|jgi:hypothetical protein|nr:DUF6580 family putative transport protein [Terriglobia bacterium]